MYAQKSCSLEEFIMLEVRIGNLRKEGVLTITPKALQYLEEVANRSWGAQLSLLCYPFFKCWVRSTPVSSTPHNMKHDFFVIGEKHTPLVIAHYHLNGFSNHVLDVLDMWGPSLVLSIEHPQE